MDKLKSTIKQFVRDWSDDGKSERDTCYQPIINEILKYFPRDECDVSKINILVPGAGLGRLAWEIAMHGYACQGNEWSFFMLFSSNFVLNRCSQINAFKLYPWIHQFSNNRRSADQIRPVYFPDVNPHNLPSNANFSMTAGDFQEIYTDHSPLLYHFENLANEISIELSYEDIKTVMLQCGFHLEGPEHR
ncbi:hypothetical protein FKM82_000622 [Ascaphus truei]